MKKCLNCGTEFDGKFCPECGTEWKNKKVCPRCGATSGIAMKFCAECGHRFEQNQSVNMFESKDNVSSSARNIDPERHQRTEARTDNSSGKYIYENRAATQPCDYESEIADVNSAHNDFLMHFFKICRFVLTLLLALYAIMLPLFYLASAEVVSVFGMEARCSVYGLMAEGDGGEIAAGVISIIFMVLVIGYVAVAIWFTFNNGKRSARVWLFGKFDMWLDECVTAFSIVLYFVMLIFSSIMLGVIGDGYIVEAGAAYKLVLAFSIIFMVISLAAVVFRIVVKNKLPEISENEITAGESISTGHTAKQENTIQKKDSVRQTKPLLYYAYSNKRLQIALMYSFLCLTLTLLLTVLFAILTLIGGVTLISPHWILFGGACGILLAVVLCYVVPIKEWSPTEFRDVVSKQRNHQKGKLGIKRIFFLIPELVLLVICIVLGGLVYGVVMRGYIIACVYGVIGLAAFIVASHAKAKRNHAMAEYLFGCPGPPPGAELVVAYNRQKEINAYNAYKKDSKEKKNGANGKVKSRIVKLAVSCSLFVVVTLFAIIASPLLTDKFSVGYVTSMPDYIRTDTLRLMFGEPTGVYKNRNETSDELYTVVYMDNDLEDLYEQEYLLEKQAEAGKIDMVTAEAKEQAIRQKMIAGSFEQLSITINGYFGSYSSEIKDDDNSGTIYNCFDNEWENYYLFGTVVEIELCKNYNLMAKNIKTVSDITLSKNEFLYGSDPKVADVNAEIYYTDGSYRYITLSKDVLSNIDTSMIGAQTLSWKDNWGQYSVDINIKYSINDNRPHTHKYTTTTISPTCSAQGYTLHTCECGEQYKDTYVSATGKHVYNDYFSNRDATCLTDGTETAKCVSCTLTNTRVKDGSATGHNPVGNYTTMYSVHWQLCKTCGKHVEESHKYDTNNKCTVCNYQLIPEPNLRYELSYDRLYYTVSVPSQLGIHNLVIPAYYEGKPVRANSWISMMDVDTPTRITFAHGITSLSTQSFTYISNLKEVIIPDTVTEVGMLVFQGSDNMTDIWCEAKSKPSGWNSQWMGNPIIYMNPAKVHWGDEWHYVHGVPVLNSETNIDEEAHVYSTVWTTDSEYHWYEPICGHDVPIDKIKHEFDEDNLCTICHYVLR